MKSAKIMIKNNVHIVIKINKYLERYVFLRIFVSKKKKKIIIACSSIMKNIIYIPFEMTSDSFLASLTSILFHR